MNKIIKVKLSDFKVIWADSGDSLATDGISTCIGIMFNGTIGNRQFLAMYHWAGFDTQLNKDNLDDQVKAERELKSIFKTLAFRIKFWGRAGKPNLNQLHLIGGEQKQEHLSGTEMEVNALFKAEEYSKLYFNVLDNFTCKRDHYLTTGTDTLMLVLSSSGVTGTKDEYCDSESEYSDESDDSDDSDDQSTLSFSRR
jgi:hypothetical protein